MQKKRKRVLFWGMTKVFSVVFPSWVELYQEPPSNFRLRLFFKCRFGSSATPEVSIFVLYQRMYIVREGKSWSPPWSVMERTFWIVELLSVVLGTTVLWVISQSTVVPTIQPKHRAFLRRKILWDRKNITIFCQLRTFTCAERNKNLLVQ